MAIIYNGAARLGRIQIGNPIKAKNRTALSVIGKTNKEFVKITKSVLRVVSTSDNQNAGYRFKNM